MDSIVTSVSIERLSKASLSAPLFGCFLCLRGQAKILLDNQYYMVEEGSLCLYTPGVLLKVLDSSPDIDGLCKVCAMENYTQIAGLMSVRDQLRVRSQPCVRLDSEEIVRIRLLNSVLDAFLENLEENVPDSSTLKARLDERLFQSLVGGLCCEVLKDYFSHVSVQAMPKGRSDEVFSQFLQDAYRFCHQNRSVDFYARRQGLSPYYFSTLVKESSGRTALDWITDVTMVQARELLQNRLLSVREVSSRLGFQDQSIFGRYFRQHEGVSPSAYRKGL